MSVLASAAPSLKGAATGAAEPLFSINGLEVAFESAAGSLRVLGGVDLSLGRGEALGIVGESGSGKTLTFMAALGLLGRNARVSGEVHFAGRKLTGLSESELLAIRGRKIGMIFQDPQSALNPVRTIGAHLTEVLRLHAGLARSAAHDRAVELLSMVGIPAARERLGSYPHELSGGMCQRAMIAIALAPEPELLIADEPTTALDATVQLQVLELLSDIRERTGMAMVMISHDLGVVAELCSRVSIMYAGRVVENGRVPEIFEKPCHPYTEALLSCLPSLDGDAVPVTGIAGDVPVAGAYPPGCVFAPRCARASAICGWSRPILQPVAGHAAYVACHNPIGGLH